MTAGDPSDELYALPLERFTAERDALAARLRERGEKDRAAEVKKLRKPSLAAWAADQVAHRDPGSIELLLELRERLQEASDAATLRSVSEERKQLIADLVTRAEAILEEAGRGTGAATMQAITQTFQAGDDEGQREDLLRGRLARELKPAGFGGSMLAIEPEETDAADEKLRGKRERADELAREADDAEREAKRLEREAASAERAAERARAAASAARTEAEAKWERANRARADLDRHR